MQNYDDRIILDEEVEVKYEKQQNEIVEVPKGEEHIMSYSNRNVSTNTLMQVLFSKKFLTLTLSTLSIIMTLFLKFLIVCGVKSAAFIGIWFFLCMLLTTTSLVLNVINFAKNKKVDFNVSTIITIISLFALFIV